MLHGAIVFLGVTLIAAILGFGGTAGSTADVARLFFMPFLAVSLITLVRGWMDLRPSCAR